MALYLPIRAISRSQQVRIGGQKITTDTTAYVDISDGKTRRELFHHSFTGAYIVVGPLTDSNAVAVVDTGLVTTADGTPDQAVDVSAGELVNRATGAYVSSAGSQNLAATAAHASLARVDIVQVNYSTGVVSYLAGTAAASPSAPTPTAGNIAIASITRAANDNTIATGDITDVRPR